MPSSLMDPATLRYPINFDAEHRFKRWSLTVSVHHPELLYHVARHGGISAATRKIPYGDSAAGASSGQILQLEKSLGLNCRPFQRRARSRSPPPGASSDRVRRTAFFSRVGEVVPPTAHAKRNARLRLAAPRATILRGHLPRAAPGAPDVTIPRPYPAAARRESGGSRAAACRNTRSIWP